MNIYASRKSFATTDVASEGNFDNRPAGVFPVRNASKIPLPRLQHLARKVHGLGPRPLFEMFRELDSGGDFECVLERYARIAALGEFISDLGGDQLPAPARLVGGRQ
jgi:hypothetical protein